MRSLRRFFSVFAFSSLLLAIGAPMALAHGTIYFEFAPDAWASQRLVVSTGETPYQLFELPTSITLTAYDLWVDNTGEPGPLTLTLADSQGTTLATNNVTLPSLPALPGGNKFHINLANDVVLQAGETYSLKIDSSLLGFGLYYADRIAFLSHNQNFTNEYVNGLARLGQAKQSFTFKFALRTPSSTGGATNDDEGEAATESPTATATTPQQISISNAHVAGTTATSVTIAWSTDIAADSRVAIRSQLDPLYVVGTGYDPTLELEHTITVTGLTPNANYFADVFSSQGSAIVLTTYTLGFRTLSGSVTPLAMPTNNPTAQNPTTQNPLTPTVNNQGTETQSPSANNSSQSTSDSNSSDSAGTSGTETSTPGGINVGPGSNASETSVSWTAPGGVDPVDGYRIDVFDAGHNIERKIYVPAGTHNKGVPKLDPGIHHVIVYANNGNIFTKIAPMASFLLKSENMGFVWKIILLVVLWIGSISGYFLWKFKKEKTVLPPEEGYDPDKV